MNIQLFKFSLIQNVDSFIKEYSKVSTNPIPETYDGWFELFLVHLGYTVEDQMPDFASANTSFARREQ
jgi:hypothetical protein